MARRPRQAHAGQSLVEYLLLITVIGIGCIAGMGYLRNSTATAYGKHEQALIAPTFVPSTYVAPTATPTPVTEVRTAVQLDSANTKTEESQYQVRLYNDGYAPVSGLKARIFFNLARRMRRSTRGRMSPQTSFRIRVARRNLARSRPGTPRTACTMWTSTGRAVPSPRGRIARSSSRCT